MRAGRALAEEESVRSGLKDCENARLAPGRLRVDGRKIPPGPGFEKMRSGMEEMLPDLGRRHGLLQDVGRNRVGAGGHEAANSRYGGRRGSGRLPTARWIPANARRKRGRCGPRFLFPSSAPSPFLKSPPACSNINNPTACTPGSGPRAGRSRSPRPWAERYQGRRSGVALFGAAEAEWDRGIAASPPGRPGQKGRANGPPAFKVFRGRYRRPPRPHQTLGQPTPAP